MSSLFSVFLSSPRTATAGIEANPPGVTAAGVDAIATSPSAEVDAVLDTALIAALPPGEFDALMPEGRAAQPEQASFAKLPGGFSVGDWFPEPMWLDTVRGARRNGTELVRPPSLKGLAVEGPHEAAGATKVELGPEAITRDLLNRARQAGLSEDEVNQLEAILRNDRKLTYFDFNADAGTIAAALDTRNAARALRTFLDLDVLRRFDAERLTPEIIQMLTLGVGRARTGASEGSEGILSRETATLAAGALSAMSNADYQRVAAALNNAGGDLKAMVLGADAQTERALILKAVAARGMSFLNASWGGGLAALAAPGLEVERFAAEIRGVKASTLVQRTSGVDSDGDGVEEARRQQSPNGSEAAVLQMLRAEADPIYALALHKGEAPDDQSLPALDDAYSPSTGAAYQRQAVGGSYLARTAAVDDIALLLESGADVPIAVTTGTGGSRALLITDVRGSGNSQLFLLTDPETGRTEWVSRNDMNNGNVDGYGARLSSYWY